MIAIAFQWLLSFCKFYCSLRLFTAMTYVVPMFFCRFVKTKLWPLQLSRYTNKWVACTGCTDGIGKAYTIELAKRGFKRFFLIGRNKAKLDAVADILKLKYNCEVEYRIFDFQFDDLEVLPEELSTYEIGLLVNFLGIAPEASGTTQNQPVGLIGDILKVNVLGQAKVLEKVVHGMFERNLGIVVSMSSSQGWRPISYLSSYSASKAANSFLSKCLSMENRGNNVRFQGLLPFLVATKMIGYDETTSGDGWAIVNADDYARQAVDVLGQSDLATGCIQHDVQVILSALFPFEVLSRISPIIQGRVEAQMEERKRKRLNKSK